MSKLSFDEAHALAREHGGTLCFFTEVIPEKGDEEVEWEECAVSLSRGFRTGLTFLAIQNDRLNYRLLIRIEDLRWMLEELEA